MSSTLNIADILSEGRVACSIKLDSKKRVLQTISELCATAYADSNSQNILDQLVARERLGSTSIGHGVAIPHARYAKADKIVGSLLYLKEPIDFAVHDTEPVDIIFGLIIPEDCTDEHLQILKLLATMMSDKNFRNCLRHAKDKETLYQKAIDYHG